MQIVRSFESRHISYSLEMNLYIMEEKNTMFDHVRNFLLVFLPALFLAVLIYSALSGRFTRPKTEKRDTTPPSIMLTRDNRYFVQPGEQYVEEGYAAYDDTDGDLTRDVEVSASGDIIRYRVSDSAGNITIRFRNIPYADTAAQDNAETADNAEAQDNTAVEDNAETEGSTEADSNNQQ